MLALRLNHRPVLGSELIGARGGWPFAGIAVQHMAEKSALFLLGRSMQRGPGGACARYEFTIAVTKDGRSRPTSSSRGCRVLLMAFLDYGNLPPDLWHGDDQSLSTP